MSSFLWDGLKRYWEALCRSLGFSPGQQGRLLVLGLDNAGKTTLLYTLSQPQAASNSGNSISDKAARGANGSGAGTRSFPPTDRPTHNTFSVPGNAGIQFTAWDLGGHEAVRHIWQDYVSDAVSAVLFVVDAADAERLEEASYELDALIGEKVLESNIPIAVLLNKCDLEAALSTPEISHRMELDRLASEHGEGKLNVFRISVLQKEGYPVAFRWISSFLK